MFNFQTEQTIDTANAGSLCSTLYTQHFIPTFHWVGWNIFERKVILFLFFQQRVNPVTMLEPLKPKPVASSVETVRLSSFIMSLFEQKREWSLYIY